MESNKESEYILAKEITIQNESMRSNENLHENEDINNVKYLRKLSKRKEYTKFRKEFMKENHKHMINEKHCKCTDASDTRKCRYLIHETSIIRKII